MTKGPTEAPEWTSEAFKLSGNIIKGNSRSCNADVSFTGAHVLHKWLDKVLDQSDDIVACLNWILDNLVLRGRHDCQQDRGHRESL